MAILRTFIILLFGLCIIGCSGGDSSSKPQAPMTLIVYMVADNSLNSDAIKDIKEMEYALSKINTKSNLIVYVDRSTNDYTGSQPQILEVRPSSGSSNLSSKVVKTYNEHNSTDQYVINEVLSEIIRRYPADNYGLILWSHSSGWIKSNMTSNSITASRAFGLDNNFEINNDALAACLPRKFNFIWFDCCLMGNIESLYEYRHKADTIIASPLEVQSGGIPYEKVVSHLLQHNCTKAAQTFFKHYSQKEIDFTTQTEVLPYATISVFVPSKFENLASTIADITTKAGGYPQSPSRAGIQRLSCVSTYSDLIFDMPHSIGMLFGDQARQSVNLALQQAMTYHAHTPLFLSLSLTHCNGVSCYVPLRTTSYHDTYYRTLSWAKAIGWDK